MITVVYIVKIFYNLLHVDNWHSFLLNYVDNYIN